jgi:hypothetical protein
MVIGMKNDRKRIFTFEQYQSALHLLRSTANSDRK